VIRHLLFAATLALLPTVSIHAQTVPPPPALTLDQVPPVPVALRAATAPYLEARSATVEGWNPATHGLLIATRFGNSVQLHEVAGPGMARTQISFEEEPIADGAYAPHRGDALVVTKDVGGAEFFQLYSLKDGRLTLLTDGRSRNEGARWDREGRRLAYTSTRRDGTDSDIYLMDPRVPASDHMAAQVAGNGWAVTDFAPGGGRALVEHFISISQTELFEMDTASGAMRRLTPQGAAVAWSGATYGPDGAIYVISDKGSDFARLGRLGADGAFSPVNPEPKWDVEDFAVAEDGRFIAYVVNEDGVSRLRLLDPATGRVRSADLPAGVISGLSIAPWGQVAFTLASATSPGDAFVLDPATMAVTQWTHSETGGLDPRLNRPPELVTVKSFDGLKVSGLLYRPDPARFPGRRPLIVNIHGGPEGQSRPGFLGRTNYLINELGVAVFYPNVRGSTGYGKTFVSLDNGPFKREDSVKDIGAFLDALAKDPGLDPDRFGDAGGSYGGYMCYASAIHYAGRFRAAQCTVAISNFVTFLEHTQSYRRDLRRVEYGDERDPVQRAKLMEISPLTRIREIKAPLFVVTGGNDPRVPPSEAAQVVSAVRANGGEVWHMIAADEGHGYRKKANVDYNFWAVVLFWEKYLVN
jgi:dipeptidyl aminopeptidase/acylaminoacyl peptidase